MDEVRAVNGALFSDELWEMSTVAANVTRADTPYDEFGRWLNRRLAERDLGQAALAQRLGVTRQLVNAWVAGKQRPGEGLARRLADELGVADAEVLSLCGHPLATLRAAPGRSISIREVPVIGRGPRGSGEDAVIGHVPWAPSVAEARGHERFFAVIADADDRVGAQIEAGDYVIIDREAKPIAGRVICLRLAGRLELRRFEQRHGRLVVANEDGLVEAWEPLATAYQGLVIQSQAPPKYP